MRVEEWFLKEIPETFLDAQEGIDLAKRIYRYDEAVQTGEPYILAAEVACKFRNVKLSKHKEKELKEKVFANFIELQDKDINYKGSADKKRIFDFVYCYVLTNFFIGKIEKNDIDPIIDYCIEHIATLESKIQQMAQKRRRTGNQ